MNNYMDYLANRIGYTTYNEYLKSDHWLVFSKGVRRRICYCCGKRNLDLQVHHTTYERLGKEMPFDVETVCGGCHVAIHEITKSGTSLEKAHIVYRQYVNERRKKKQKAKQWVIWFRLVNKAKHQTLNQLKAFLTEKGLLDGKNASDKAYRMGFVRLEDGKEKWHLKKYVEMMQADNKLKKLQEQGKEIHLIVRRRALAN